LSFPKRPSFPPVFFTVIFLVSISAARAQLPAAKSLVTPVGPGVWYREIYRPAGPWAIHVIEFDRHNPHLHLKTFKANDLLRGNERTSSMAARSDSERHRVVAAINGDFYAAGGVPINLHVINGEILRGPAARSVFAVSDAGRPLLEIFTLAGSLQSARGMWQPVHGINRTRNADELIFFNRYFGSSTGTNDFGSEIRIQPLTKFWLNDTIRAVVREFRRNSGNTSIDDSTYIISGHGSAERWVTRHIAAGDTVRFVWRTPESPWRLAEAIGGLPRIVRDGKVSIESQREVAGDSFTNNRHPRTAVGFNADSSRIFFVTVDGRQPGYSEGMTLTELGELMRELGCAQAVNLDGGGSTTMVVRGKVVNRPSDATGERAVANALLLISTAPTGALTQIRIQPPTAITLAGENVDFNVAATDSFYNLLDLTDEDIFWETPARLGRIDGQGVFTAGAREDSGYVVAHRSHARDSAHVVVTVLKHLRLSPDPVILEIGQIQPMQATLIDSRARPLVKPPREFQWEVEGKCGGITTEGVFTASDTGKCWIVARFGSGGIALTGRAEVRVGHKEQ
jgi:hypothetical protein